MLLNSESTKKFMENEFDIVGDYLEFLSEEGIDGSLKNNDDIDNYIDKCKDYNHLSKSGEKLFRRAINRFYRIRKK